MMVMPEKKNWNAQKLSFVLVVCMMSSHWMNKILPSNNTLLHLSLPFYLKDIFIFMQKKIDNSTIIQYLVSIISYQHFLYYPLMLKYVLIHTFIRGLSFERYVYIVTILVDPKVLYTLGITSHFFSESDGGIKGLV